MTGAAAGGGDAGQQGDGGQQGGEGAGTGPDFGALTSLVEAQGQQLGEMREFLQSNPWGEIQGAQQGDPAQQQQEPGLDVDLSFLDPEIAATMDPQQLEQRLQQTISQAAESIADRKVQERVGPVEEGLAEMRRNSEVTALVGEFPEMAQPETAQGVLQAAGQIAEQMGRPELANEPSFWRLTYMAGRAADAAQEETGDIPSPATLESGAGATPGGGQGDLGDQIIGARRGASVLPFG